MNKCFVILYVNCFVSLFVIKLCYAVTYTDQWAVHIEGGVEVAKQVADEHGFTYLGQIFTDHYHFNHHHVTKRSTSPSHHIHEPLAQNSQVKWAEQQIAKNRVKRDTHFSDPKWPRMWYLNRGHHLDMNVEAAWQNDITGRGIVVSILDDGIERDHPDLKKNYDPKASYDVNGNDPDPTPRYDYTNENRHGTRCAGEVAAEADNKVCSVGIAYNAGIGGVRMLDGDVTDAVEARSLGHNPQNIDIYSASWGPDDDGETVDGPAPLAKKAFEDGIKKGRGGKGSIFVWASGNGGRDGDSCNCDGYTNSIFTLSISSVTESGNIPWYSEACSSTLTTTYSSGSGAERQIVTTDLRKECTEYHTGTSASAPLAAGICALVLEANTRLTWRDMQHIVVETSQPANLKAGDWVTNGNGRKVSHHFGFGLMDAGAMVEKARNWTRVPEQHQCEIRAYMSPKKIAANSSLNVTLASNGCSQTHNEVMYLEHVQAIITLGASRRGQVEIFLTSPTNTKSTLLAKRNRDTSMEGFTNWGFMTTHNWGELSMGMWTLQIVNSGSSSVLKNWSLVLYGTATRPGSNSHSHHVQPNQECSQDQVFFHGQCQENCPVTFFQENQTFQVANSTQSPDNMTEDVPTLPDLQQIVLPSCSRCSPACYECHGPGNDHCSSCLPNYTIDGTVCMLNTNNPLDYILRHPKGIVVFIVVCVIILILAIFIITVLIMRFRNRCCAEDTVDKYIAKHAKYRLPDESRIGNKNMAMENGSTELRSQTKGLLTLDADDFDDEIDFQDMVILRENVPSSSI